jgi:hypothetical protein
MTVNELIEQLKDYPGDMTILTLGYEGGFNNLSLRTEDIVFNVNDKDKWYYGPHECVKYTDSDISMKCVIVVRER